MSAARLTRRRLAAPSLEALFVGALVLFGWRLGAKAIKDNSMLLHLRTGMEIARGDGVPRADPYSYTAAGEDWTVQSWLAEVTYGLLERLGGLELVVMQQAVLMALLAGLIVYLARAGTPLRTAAAGTIAVGIGAAYWVPRPLLFGLLGMALLVTVVERRRSAWWLAPLAWVWANAHGSFVLGLGWLALRGLGETADDRRLPRHVLRYGAVFAGGTLLGAVGPLGLRLLTFPLTAIERRDVLRTLTEWRSPDFTAPDGMVAAAFLGLALVVLARARPSWRDLVPVVAFVVAGLLAMRNIPVAGIVAAPALGRALRTGPCSDAAPAIAGRLNWAFAGILLAAAALFAGSIWQRGPLDLERYPVAAVDWLDSEGLLDEPHLLAHDEVVGGYLVFRYGQDARVFIDDRLDMYPEHLSRELDTLIAGTRPSLDVLDRHGVDVVLWRQASSLGALLERSGGWRRSYEDESWVVWTR